MHVLHVVNPPLDMGDEVEGPHSPHLELCNVSLIWWEVICGVHRASAAAPNPWAGNMGCRQVVLKIQQLSAHQASPSYSVLLSLLMWTYPFTSKLEKMPWEAIHVMP